MADMSATRSGKQALCNPLGIAARSDCFSDGEAAGSAPVSRLERGLLKAMLHLLGNPPVAVHPWQGDPVVGAGSLDRANRVHLGDRGALFRLVLDPEFQFGELYSSGRLQIEGDLARLIETLFTSQGIGPGALSRLLGRVHAPRSNLLGQSNRNIHHHYDLGNDFYRLWLDRQLLYTCAYFSQPSLGLEDAQIAKMDMICRKLHLKPGETVIEAGCGWGAMALHMARHYGVRVIAYNLSHAQVAYARQLAREERLDSRVSFVEADYRAIRGNYDVFVSIGMLEHVGRRHYRDFATMIDRCLDRNGRGFIQAIGSDQVGVLNPWIEQRIFPGAYPPTLRELLTVLEPAGMSVLDVENLRLHYALTLEHWLSRFEAARDSIEAMFGATFVRAWRLYLAGSLAAFRCGRLQLFQVLFQRNGDNRIAWTRAPLYMDKDSACGTPTS